MPAMRIASHVSVRVSVVRETQAKLHAGGMMVPLLLALALTTACAPTPQVAEAAAAARHRLPIPLLHEVSVVLHLQELHVVLQHGNTLHACMHHGRGCGTHTCDAVVHAICCKRIRG